ncbi:SapC family protein [Ramlibacter sp. G-1-2-2]|uniref:SapC family protein n=1 Tax=Ramlibacter agri TaxID=2728837 RepID=A0A848HEZ9_9BURK|nr:SapC family protein [Ramlibacter agri]NML48050.1 SapC family protein [Ramlibacter agri]
MAKQLMIYESAVPVQYSRHGKWSVDAGADFGFSRTVNSVPLTAVEFLAAASEYVIIFAGTGDVVTPAVLLGMRDEENLYLSGDGGWKARYVPAFLRRYPFVFASRDEGKSFTLCIDESFPGFKQDGAGKALFDEPQKPSEYTQNVLKFLQQYQLEFQRTQDFCRKLKELNLLEPMRAQVSLDSGERIALGGFMAVDRARLKTLSSDKLAELVKSDELELIYAHLLSLRNIGGMRERLASAAAVTTVATADEAADSKKVH